MSQLFVLITLILLPGVTAAIFVDKLTVHRKWDSFRYSLYSVVLGTVSYSLLQVLYYIQDMITVKAPGIPKWTNLHIWDAALRSDPTLSGFEIVLAVLLSFPLALGVSLVVNFKLINKLGKKLGVSTKFGDENLFSYYLNTEEIDWVYVRDVTNNLTYQGRVESFSENTEIQEIVLSEVTVFRYEDSAELYSVPTIYLARPAGNYIIEQIPRSFLGESNEKETVD